MYLSGSLFDHLVSCSRSFHKGFHLTFLRIFFLSFRAFSRERKKMKSLDTRSGEYNGWGRIDHYKPNIFFLCDACWMSPCVIIEKYNFSPIYLFGRFFRRLSSSRCSGWEYNSVLSVWFRLKTQNTTVITRNTQHKLYSIKLCLWGWLLGFILTNPLPFAWNMIKDPFFWSPAMIFLRNESFFFTRKRTYYHGYKICLIRTV